MAEEQSALWASGAAYESYVGRWSRIVAREFLGWLEVPAGVRWLDVGCGTGELTKAILETQSPNRVVGIDPSEGFIAFAREHVQDENVEFDVGDAMSLPYGEDEFDSVVSGLALNFVPGPDRALSGMARVTRPEGIVAAYVWDYAGKMEMIRRFFDAATDVDPAAAELDEGRRFPICNPERLAEIFRSTGLRDVETRAIDVPAHFRDFDDYWTPFLAGTGVVPAYVVSLAEAKRKALQERLRETLPIAQDGSISLIARAWAVKGRT
jgi:ubiquinone/menaquinone biosynthesis C-methylase UbiE